MVLVNRRGIGEGEPNRGVSQMAVRAELAVSSAACRLRVYAPGDEEAILALHNRIAPTPRSLAHWRWKYEDNPAGTVLVTVAEDERGRIIGHFGSIPARARVDGHPCRMVQGVDSMVDIAYRRALRKDGLFTRLTRFYISEFEKKRQASDPGAPEFWRIGYGFPTPEVLRLAERFLGYLPLARVGSLAASVDELQRRLRPNAAEQAFHVRQAVRVDSSVDRLWHRCAGEIPTGIVRDQVYLHWRYGTCPDQTYHTLLAENRLTGEVEGLAVLSIGWQDRPAVAIADWLVPGYAGSAARALLRATLATAEAEKCQDIVAWFPATSSWYIDLVAQGFRPAPSGYCLVIFPFCDPLPPEAIERTWYYTLGDSDMV